MAGANGSPEEPKQEAQQAPDPMAAINEKLKPFGVTAQMVLPIIQPLIMEAVKATLAEMKLPQILQGAVDKTVDAKVGQFVEQLQAQAGLGGAPAGNGGAPAKAGLGAGGIGIQDLISIGNMLGLGKKEGGEMTNLLQLAKVMGEATAAFHKPYEEAERRGEERIVTMLSAIQRNPDAIQQVFGQHKKDETKP